MDEPTNGIDVGAKEEIYALINRLAHQGSGVLCISSYMPEVMDIWSLLPQYRGRLAFHGGLSTQQTLPFGTVEEVKDEVDRLLALGRDGGYILAPAHDVEGDVPLENMLAFIDTAKEQSGYKG